MSHGDRHCSQKHEPTAPAIADHESDPPTSRRGTVSIKKRSSCDKAPIVDGLAAFFDHLDELGVPQARSSSRSRARMGGLSGAEGLRRGSARTDSSSPDATGGNARNTALQESVLTALARRSMRM